MSETNPKACGHCGHPQVQHGKLTGSCYATDECECAPETRVAVRLAALERVATVAKRAAELLGNASLAFDDHDPMGQSMYTCAIELRAALAGLGEETK